MPTTSHCTPPIINPPPRTAPSNCPSKLLPRTTSCAPPLNHRPSRDRGPCTSFEACVTPRTVTLAPSCDPALPARANQTRETTSGATSGFPSTPDATSSAADNHCTCDGSSQLTASPGAVFDITLTLRGSPVCCMHRRIPEASIDALVKTKTTRARPATEDVIDFARRAKELITYARGTNWPRTAIFSVDHRTQGDMRASANSSAPMRNALARPIPSVTQFI